MIISSSESAMSLLVGFSKFNQEEFVKDRPRLTWLANIPIERTKPSCIWADTNNSFVLFSPCTVSTVSKVFSFYRCFVHRDRSVVFSVEVSVGHLQTTKHPLLMKQSLFYWINGTLGRAPVRRVESLRTVSSAVERMNIYIVCPIQWRVLRRIFRQIFPV